MDREENIRRLVEARKPREKKPYKGIAKKSAKKIKQEAEAKKANSVESREESLSEWFDKIAKKHTLGGVGFCMECGAQISAEYMRHATAHLLAKKLFKSVATNDLNYLILCAGNGCHDKTHRIDKFIQMKIWPIAAKQINALLPLLPYDELKYVSQKLYDALENY
jgi:RNA polymerase-binding transcription factor DksA